MTREERLDRRRQRALHVTQSLEPGRVGQWLAERRRPGALLARFAPAYQEPVPLQSRQPAQAFNSLEAGGLSPLRSMIGMLRASKSCGYRRAQCRRVAVP